MNIIYIGDFRRPYDTELYVKRGLEELGHNVKCLQESGINNNGNINGIVKDLIDMKIDLVLLSKCKQRGTIRDLVEELKKTNIKTAVWLFDLYFNIVKHRELMVQNKDAPFNCDFVFTTDGGHDKEFKEYGINHITLKQGIYEPEAILYDRPKTQDIVFVGADSFGTRRKMLEMLNEVYGNRFKWYGQFITSHIRNLPLNEVYASSKIVVGDSQPSPNYWSNRVYETLGRGGFLLHPMVEGLDKEFKIGKHLVTYEYGNHKDLLDKIEYYLEHEEEREKIRKAGFEYCKKHYTYKKRCETLIKHINEHKS